MRHRVATKTFSRNTKQRSALFKNLVRQVVEHGSITTTTAKAKETKRLVDKVMAKALNDSISTRRQLHEYFGKRDVVNTLVTKIAPLFSDRKSGFTTIKSAGVRRGDNTPLSTLSLIKTPEGDWNLKNPAPKTRPASKKVKATKNIADKKASAQKASATKSESKAVAKKSTAKKSEKKTSTAKSTAKTKKS